MFNTEEHVDIDKNRTIFWDEPYIGRTGILQYDKHRRILISLITVTTIEKTAPVLSLEKKYYKLIR